MKDTRVSVHKKLSVSLGTIAAPLFAGLLSGVVSLSASAQAPLPYVEGNLLKMPVVQIFDTPFRIDWQIVAGPGFIDLLLHDFEELGSTDMRGAPSFWEGILNLPHLEVDGVSLWGEFYIESEQPITLRLGNVGFNDSGSSGLQGKWRITEEIDAEACGEGSDISIYELSVQHQGQNLVVSTAVGEFQAQLSGNTLNWSGSYAEEGGTTTTTIDALFAATFDEVSGSSNWTWSNGSFSCSGTTSFTGVLLHN